MLFALRTLSQSLDQKVDPTRCFHHAPSGLYGDGVYHNCVASMFDPVDEECLKTLRSVCNVSLDRATHLVHLRKLSGHFAVPEQGKSIQG